MFSKKSAFFVDNYGNIGVGTQRPKCTLDLYNSTDGILLPRNNASWNYISLPTSNAAMRYNPNSKSIEVLEYSQWVSLTSISKKPQITTVSSTQLINANSSINVYGSNFEPGLQVTFIGSDRRIIPTTLTYSNETLLTISRSSNMPVYSAPYRMRIYNPSNGFDVISPMTFSVGIAPVFTTTSNYFGPLYPSSNYNSIGWITCRDDTYGAICNMSIYPTNALDGSGVSNIFISSSNLGILSLSGIIPPSISATTVYNFRVSAIDSGSNETLSEIYALQIKKPL